MTDVTLQDRDTGTGPAASPNAYSGITTHDAATPMRPVRRWWRPRLNPVLRRELRVRMRGPRAFAVLGAYVLLLILAIAVIERVMVRYDTGGLQSFQVGQVLFAGLVLLQGGLLMLIGPALTATAITGERERGTFDMLRTTPVRPSAIVIGKLTAALSYVALLLVAAVPVLAVVYLYGGVVLPDIGVVFLLLAVVALAFGLLGLVASAAVRRTGAAAVLAYMLVAGIAFGPPTVFLFLDAVDGGLLDGVRFEQIDAFEQEQGLAGGADVLTREGDAVVVMEPAVPGDDAPKPMPVAVFDERDADIGSAPPGQRRIEPTEPPLWLLAFNPLISLGDLVGGGIDQSASTSFTGGTSTVPVMGELLSAFRQVVGLEPVEAWMFDAFGNEIPPAAVRAYRPLWQTTLMIYAGIAIVAYIAAVALVGRGWPGRRWRLRWRR